ncbi:MULTISPECIES: type IV pilin-like G/H family protein [Cyanophyceae]|uniref:type IV pilin-like G/H family protein n=1 Tax=Cyanophyceae TaxID=3028117 RepID=UPI001682ECD7|nr:type IV pilin-like G/H family protein [Trichocoleus sp. FACHB-69]MBD1934840.1 type IV pilin-like G/H family protein [Trichocoleus sp. FACHB-69]
MKTELKAKFLQHLNQKKQEEGFTLIELLVVIIIIGILAAIALPSFLNQANKARESEAKSIVGSMNRAQQAFYLENQDFVGQADFTRLGLGIAKTTSNYSYVIDGGAATNDTAVTNQAQPVKGNQAPVRAYIGGVAVGTQGVGGEATTLASLCQAVDPPIKSGAAVNGAQKPGFSANAVPDCKAGTTGGKYDAIK